MTFPRATLCVLLAALLGVLTLIWVVPDYLTSRGYPLDDAWIYAVYGRSLAQEGNLAYNPGVPATGATSPLWPVVLAVPHLLWSQPGAVVVAVKLIGLMLHVLTAVLMLAAFRGTAGVDFPVLAGATLVALHPDLISGSASGMEVPLSTTLAAALLLAGRAGSFVPYLAVSFVAPLARPELGLLAIVIPIGLYLRTRPRLLIALSVAAGAGTALSFGVVAVRNMAVSGRPLVATFYAKAGSGGLSLPSAEFIGFGSLLGQFPIVDSSVLMCIASVVGVALLFGKDVDANERLASVAFLGGLIFCAASFALVRPIDPGALYHQRYVLPVVPLLVVALPVVLHARLKRVLPNSTSRIWGLSVILLLFTAGIVIDSPARYRHLENDARNIDDVQVALGKSLAGAARDQAVWVVDAGAVRYFGSAFVVDLIGLNSDALLGPGAQEFLDRHPPRFVEVVPGWSGLDEESGRGLRGMLFRPSTPYTVSGFRGLPMQRHLLVRCDDASPRRTVFLRRKSFGFRCAS